MRIISLSPSITEILFAIKKGNEIVGNTYFCDYPEDAKKIQKIGSWTDIHWDKVQQLAPDIIFTSTVVQEKMAQEYSHKFNIVHFDPRSLYDIYEDISRIGKSINAENNAKKVVASMQEKENTLRKKNFKKNIKVYVEEWYEPPMVSGNWVPDIIEIAGGQFNWVKKGDISRVITTEEVIANNPDIIFVAYCGFGLKSDITKITQRKEWSEINAIKNGKVFAIDENILNRPGPRILDIAEDISQYIETVDSKRAQDI